MPQYTPAPHVPMGTSATAAVEERGLFTVMVNTLEGDLALLQIMSDLYPADYGLGFARTVVQN